MIVIPRTVLRDCRAVFRRVGYRTARSPGILIHLVSDKSGVRIRSLQDDVRVEFHHPTPAKAASLVLPMELLTHCEGNDASAVQLEPLSNGNVKVLWQHLGVPRIQEYALAQAQE